MNLKIRTNHHWREFAYRWDVPADVLADQFDWTNEAYETHGDYLGGFFCYHGHWYHLGDFMRTNCELLDLGWHGYAGDSFFSGVAIRLSDDGERFQVATVIAGSEAA